MMLKQIQSIGQTIYDVYATDHYGNEILLGSTTDNKLTVENVSIGDMAKYKHFYVRARYEKSGALTSENSSSIEIACDSCSKPVEIPNMTGWTKEKVEEWAESYNISLSFTETPSNEVTSGLVLSTSPANGTLLPGGSLTVMIASPQLIVPNYQNEPNFINQYENWASLNSIKVVIKEEYHDTIAAGDFIGSNPGIGASIEQGSTLTITISKGPNIGGSDAEPDDQLDD